jgi:hypothetical protein
MTAALVENREAVRKAPFVIDLSANVERPVRYTKYLLLKAATCIGLR